MKKNYLFFLLVLLVMKDSGYSDDKVIAYVGRKVVLESEVHRLMKEENLDFSKALSQTITQKLLLVEAEKENIKISREELMKEVAAVRERIGGEENLRKRLQEENLSYEGFLQRLEENLKIERLLFQKVTRNIKITTAELLQMSSRLQPDCLFHLKGKDFPSREQAQQYYASWVPEKEKELEDVGWIAVSEMKPSVRDAVSQVKTGQLTAPVLVIERWHVFLVTEVKTQDVSQQTLGKTWKQLYQEKYNQALFRLLEELQKQIPVRILVAEK